MRFLSALVMLLLFALPIQAAQLPNPSASETPAATPTHSAGTDELVGAWNLAELKRPPPMRWLARTGVVHSLLYAGEKFQGRDTEVFAFYASPATLGETGTVEEEC